MKLRLTRRAARELAEVAAYIALRNPVAATRIEAEFRAAFELISHHPRVGRLLAENIRRLPLPKYPYLIFYRLREGGVEVVSIRHAARSPEFK